MGPLLARGPRDVVTGIELRFGAGKVATSATARFLYTNNGEHSNHYQIFRHFTAESILHNIPPSGYCSL